MSMSTLPRNSLSFYFPAGTAALDCFGSALLEMNHRTSPFPPRLFYNDVDLASQAHQNPHDALYRHIPKLTLQQARNVRLAESHDLRGLSLCQLLLANQLVYPSYKLGFEQMGIGICISKICK